MCRKRLNLSLVLMGDANANAREKDVYSYLCDFDVRFYLHLVITSLADAITLEMQLVTVHMMQYVM